VVIPEDGLVVGELLAELLADVDLLPVCSKPEDQAIREVAAAVVVDDQASPIVGPECTRVATIGQELLFSLPMPVLEIKDVIRLLVRVHVAEDHAPIGRRKLDSSLAFHMPSDAGERIFGCVLDSHGAVSCRALQCVNCPLRLGAHCTQGTSCQFPRHWRIVR